MRAEYDVEPLRPILPAIRRDHGSFADVISFWLPGASNQSVPAADAVGAAQDDGAIVPVAFDNQRLTPIRHPTLAPHLFRRVVGREALAVMAIDALIVFQ